MLLKQIGNGEEPGLRQTPGIGGRIPLNQVMQGIIAELKLDHIGIEVPDLQIAIRNFTELFGYHAATRPVVNTRHQVEVVFLEKAGSLPLKLIRQLNPTRTPPTKLHHVAFRTDSVESSIDELVARGARVLNPPAPGEAFDDEPIAFLYAGGLNVELVSTDKRRDRIPSAPATGT